MNPSGVSRRARVGRGLIATFACLLLAVLGHARAGGALPTGEVLAALAVPLAALLITLADRRRGPLAIFALLGGSQLALHTSLQLLGGHRSGGSVGDGAAMAAGDCAMAHSSVTSMVGAHVLATVVAAAILAGAERAALVLAFAVVDAVTIVLARRPRLPARDVDGAGSGLVRPIPHTGRLRGILARRLNARRGPPLPVAG
jgi:hypothetical protein